MNKNTSTITSKTISKTTAKTTSNATSTTTSKITSDATSNVTSKTTGKKEIKNVWVLMIYFSGYKDDDCYDVDCRCFAKEELALTAMRSEARRLYKQSNIIQEAEDKYFHEYVDKSSKGIDFGESWGQSDYRREFGFCQVKRAKLEFELNEEDIYDSTDESEDDDSE
ncbi:5622_t:CDS:2 [Paraglomus occultum]|uniref:5622_t:CDS:1 n=1 Tax=Paraglomus occultum TaxID=144539 RepID=A0A9N9DP18_9GLOM|nr:5622_t:CDS:2 [Paraglomus occultum]